MDNANPKCGAWSPGHISEGAGLEACLVASGRNLRSHPGRLILRPRGSHYCDAIPRRFEQVAAAVTKGVMVDVVGSEKRAHCIQGSLQSVISLVRWHPPCYQAIVAITVTLASTVAENSHKMLVVTKKFRYRHLEECSLLHSAHVQEIFGREEATLDEIQVEAVAQRQHLAPGKDTLSPPGE